eukprot:Skav209579  [mRNA]  locus=scaffold281:247487:250094:+ [translate_table: standard]
MRAAAEKVSAAEWQKLLAAGLPGSFHTREEWKDQALEGGHFFEYHRRAGSAASLVLRPSPRHTARSTHRCELRCAQCDRRRCSLVANPVSVHLRGQEYSSEAENEEDESPSLGKNSSVMRLRQLRLTPGMRTPGRQRERERDPRETERQRDREWKHGPQPIATWARLVRRQRPGSFYTKEEWKDQALELPGWRLAWDELLDLLLRPRKRKAPVDEAGRLRGTRASAAEQQRQRDRETVVPAAEELLDRLLRPRGRKPPVDEVWPPVGDRETKRQRDRETERQRDRETERQRDREWRPVVVRFGFYFTSTAVAGANGRSVAPSASDFWFNSAGILAMVCFNPRLKILN